MSDTAKLIEELRAWAGMPDSLWTDPFPKPLMADAAAALAESEFLLQAAHEGLQETAAEMVKALERAEKAEALIDNLDQALEQIANSETFFDTQEIRMIARNARKRFFLASPKDNG